MVHRSSSPRPESRTWSTGPRRSPVSCDPASGDTFALGATTVSCTSTDAHQNTSTKNFTVTVMHSWSGALAPVTSGGSYHKGRTLPVQFTHTEASAPVTNTVAKLYLSKMSGGTVGAEFAATSTSTAVSDNSFRYAGTGYIFNLATKGLSAGTYRLRIDLADGVSPHRGHHVELRHTAAQPTQAAPQRSRWGAACLTGWANAGRPAPVRTLVRLWSASSGRRHPTAAVSSRDRPGAPLRRVNAHAPSLPRAGVPALGVMSPLTRTGRAGWDTARRSASRWRARPTEPRADQKPRTGRPGLFLRARKRLPDIYASSRPDGCGSGASTSSEYAWLA